MGKRNTSAASDPKPLETGGPVAGELTAEPTDVASAAVESVAGGHELQDEALRSTRMRLPEDPRVYQVEIDNCLLGRRFVLANSETEAIEKYKRPSGIGSHAGAASAAVTEFDPANLPDGIELWGESPAQS